MLQHDEEGADGSRLRLLGLINVAAGLWLAVLPFTFHLPRRYPHQLPFWAILTTGALVLSLATLHTLRWSRLRWTSRGNLALGVWLAASPAIIGYTKYLPNGHAVALASVLTGAGVLGGAALSLAGSRPTPTTGPTDAAAGRQAVPVLWPEPVPGQQPQPYTHVAHAAHSEADARRRMPLAWAAVATLIAAAVLLGAAVVLRSWAIALGAVALGTCGAFVAARSHILADVSISQSPEGP